MEFIQISKRTIMDLAGLLGLIVYPAWGLAQVLVFHSGYDPFYLRMMVGLLYLVLFYLSHFKKYTFTFLANYLLLVNMLTSLHLFYLAYVNHLTEAYALSLIVGLGIFAASSFSISALKIYIIFSLAVSVFFSYMIQTPQTDPILLLIMIFTLLPIIYIPMRYRFSLEEELEKNKEELEEKVKKRTEELVYAREKAEKSEQVKSNFLANMSHEIRTPLHAIMGFTSLIEKNAIGDDNHIFVDHIAESSAHLLSLVNDILDFSKIEKGYLIIENNVFLLEDMLKSIETIANILIRSQKKNTTFKYTIDSTICSFINSDSNRIKQILENLISNSVKFTESGQIELKVNLIHQDTLEFSVTDKGIGIEVDKMKDIFEPFVQADSGISRKYGGTGLGLAIVKKLVELIGGVIRLESKIGENHGTAIFFTIPYIPEE